MKLQPIKRDLFSSPTADRKVPPSLKSWPWCFEVATGQAKPRHKCQKSGSAQTGDLGALQISWRLKAIIVCLLSAITVWYRLWISGRQCCPKGIWWCESSGMCVTTIKLSHFYLPTSPLVPLLHERHPAPKWTLTQSKVLWQQKLCAS